MIEIMMYFSRHLSYKIFTVTFFFFLNNDQKCNQKGKQEKMFLFFYKIKTNVNKSKDSIIMLFFNVIKISNFCLSFSRYTLYIFVMAVVVVVDDVLVSFWCSNIIMITPMCIKWYKITNASEPEHIFTVRYLSSVKCVFSVERQHI